jgi:nondiscriminating aspartyl-tRNA synthetase
MSSVSRTFIASLAVKTGESVVLRGWISRLRVLAKTTFIILKDCSGEAQCVGTTESLHSLKLKLDDALEIRGVVRPDARARSGFEVDIQAAAVLNHAAGILPFNSSSEIGTRDSRV